MRCLSHIFLLKKEKCFKNYYPGMEKTRICYFCLKIIKKIYGYTLEDLMNKELYKKFISNDLHIELLKTNQSIQSINQQ